MSMHQQQLKQVYKMVDSIPFSRSKKNIGRDFSDGVMMAQLIHHYRPKLVQLHNYPAANSNTKKINNWNTLNKKVLKKIGLQVDNKEILDIVNCVPNAIEDFLYRVFKRLQSPQDEARISNVYQKQRQRDNSFKGNSRVKFNELRKNDHSAEINNSSQRPPRYNRTPTKNPLKSPQAQILNEQTQQVLDLVEQIQQTYAQILKLQEISKLKDDMIKNLQKKVQKMIFG